MSGIKTGNGSSSGSGGLTTSYQAANFTAAPSFSYLVRTAASAITATLPTGTAGAQIQFVDDSTSWATNNFVVAPATGQSIQGLSANDTLTANISGAFLLFSWDSVNSYWVVSGSGFQSTAPATATTPGVVSTTAQTFGGAKTFTGLLTPAGGIAGDTSAGTPAVGLVGQSILVPAVTTNNVTTAVPFTVTSITLTPGHWNLSGWGQVTGTGSNQVFNTLAISPNNASFTGTTTGYNLLQMSAVVLASGSSACISIPSMIANVTVNTTFYLVARIDGGSGIPCIGSLSAVRIA